MLSKSILSSSFSHGLNTISEAVLDPNDLESLNEKTFSGMRIPRLDLQHFSVKDAINQRDEDHS